MNQTLVEILHKNPPNFQPNNFKNSQKIRHPPKANFTRQPNQKITKFWGKNSTSGNTGFTTVRQRKYTSQHCCDKKIDGKMT